MYLLREVILVVLSTLIASSQQSLQDIVFPPPFNKDLGPDSKDPPGHLKPLGWQRPPEGPVKEYNRVLSTQEYWDNHVKSRTPLVLRQAIKKSPAIEKWSDEYLKEKYGDLDVLVELKRENRTFATGRMRYAEFIDRYNKDDLYVVTMLPRAMMHEVQAVNSVLCGTFKNFTHESNFWMSNGGTRSVIHYDADHNLHCMIAGRKDLIMVQNTPQNRKWLYMSRKPVTAGSGFSPLSPDAIDLHKYPDYAKVPWLYTTIYPGDCVYIPAIYIHQVRAYGRSLSVTTLFTEEIIGDQLKFTSEDCKDEMLKEYHTMADIDFHWTYEKGDETIDMGYMNVERLRNILRQHMLETKEKYWDFKGFKRFYKHFAYGEAQASAEEVWLNILNHSRDAIIDVMHLKQYTRAQLKLLARALDPPHGPKTDGLTKVSVVPSNEDPDDYERKKRRKVAEGDEQDGGDGDEERDGDEDEEGEEDDEDREGDERPDDDEEEGEEVGRPDLVYADAGDKTAEAEPEKETKTEDKKPDGSKMKHEEL